jgi:predicted RNA methylase
VKTITILPQVREVLARCAFYSDRVVLPSDPLPRPLYEAVNKVLDAQGGKWNKKAKAHLFPTGLDPRVVFAEALASGTIVHEKQTRQAFYTPPEIAALAVKRAEIGAPAVTTVLEPSAGEGALIAALPAGVTRIVAFENDPRAAKILRAAFPRVTLLEEDFLQSPGGEPRVDRVIMNPPFADGAEIEHVRHAFSFLKPGGRLVAIMSPAVQFRTDKRYTAFREWIEEHTEDRAFEALPENSFRESGTNVRTILFSCRLR